MPDPSNTSADRDYVAECHGWKREGPPKWKSDIWFPPGWPDTYLSITDHPFPPTLGAAARAMPEGWAWGRGPSTRDSLTREWYASRQVPITEARSMQHHELMAASRMITTPDTGREIADRYRLAALCWQAMEAPGEQGRGRG